MKKILSILLLAIMLISLVACGGKAAPEGQSQAQESNAASNQASSSNESVDNKYAEPMTITFASVQVKEGVDYNNGDDFAKFFSKKYNIKWEITPMTWDNWAEKMRIWINANDMPDLATWNYVHGEAVNYAEQGLVRKLPDDWKTKWTNVAKAYEDSQLGPTVEKILGGTYYLPKPIFSANKPTKKLLPHTSVIVRKDWFQAVGAEIKDAYKVSELMDIARKIKQQDPGKLGSKLLPINMSSDNASSFFVGSNSTYSTLSNQFYKGADNKYLWGPASEDTLAGLKLYQQAFREGLLNPEFFTLKQNEDYASYYASGQTGIYMSEGQAIHFWTVDKELKKNLNLNADDVMHVCSPLGEDGKFHSEELTNFWTASIFSPKMEQAKFERIMDMFDYVSSPEGQLMVRLGFKDKDFTVEPDGSLKVLSDPTKAIDEKYPSITPVYENMYILTDDFMMVDPSYPKKYRDLALKMYKVKESFTDDKSNPPRDWTVYFQDSPSRRKVSFELSKEYAQLITMPGNIETNWKKWVEEKKPLVDPVLQELNALNN